MMKKLYVLLFVLFSASLFAQTAIEPSGSGTENDPYLIENLENLYWISVETNGGNTFSGKYFLQTADIDASETENWNDGKGWESIGYSWSRSFRGNYNGNEHAVSGLFLSRSETNYQGLFGYTAFAVIENLELIGSDITGHNGIGGLIGWARHSDSIINCYTSGSVNGNQEVGGLVGKNWSSIINSYSSASVNGNQEVGGLVGENWGSIINSYSSASVDANQIVGGLVGSNLGSIKNSYSSASVDANQIVGGLVGSNDWGSIINSYSMGVVSGESITGGFVGSNKSIVQNSFWNIETSGQTYSSGGTGKMSVEMKSFSTYIEVAWDFKGAGPLGIWNIGNDRNDGYPYLDWQYPEDPSPDYPFTPYVKTLAVSNITDEGATLNGEIILKGNPMATQHGFCWNTTGMPTVNDNVSQLGSVNDFGTFSSTISFAPSAIYYIRAYSENGEGIHYGDQVSIFFQYEPPEPSGSGTEADPYLISSLEELLWIASQTNGDNSFEGKYFRQVANIDASPTANWNDGEGWEPIGSYSWPSYNPFSGNYIGQGHIVDGLTINRPGHGYASDQGLFGIVDGGSISNLGVTNVNIIANSQTGALAGSIYNSSVFNCFSTGNMYMEYSAGGLIGTASNSNIYNSHSKVVIDAFCLETVAIGGLIGVMWNTTIADSYFNGQVFVMCEWWAGGIGGLIGGSYSGIILNNYNHGQVITQNEDIGGLLGYGRNTQIVQSYNTGKVQGENRVGGLVGYSGSNFEIIDSYSTGEVVGETQAGGLVGSGGSTSITNSYWNTETSGQQTSDGGEGRTTDEMTYPYADNTFVDWNFETVWSQDNEYVMNNGYPFLQMQGYITNITFNVMDVHGDPVENAMLFFNGISFGAGNYVVQGMPSGTYNYVISKIGYKTKVGILNASGSSVTVPVILEKDDAAQNVVGLSINQPDVEACFTEPAIFNVSGGGSYCDAIIPSGISVELDGSEEGVLYQLFKHSTQAGLQLWGTGSSIAWHDVTEGEYTVVATNGFHYVDMNGSAVVTAIEALPVSVTINASDNDIEEDTEVTFFAHPVNGGSNPFYQWMVNDIEVGSNAPEFTYIPENGDQVQVILYSSEECNTGPAESNVITMIVGVSDVPEIRNIPHTTIPDGFFACFDATQSIIVAANEDEFIVKPGGSAELIAGENILFMPGTHVHSGGHLHAYISNNYCDTADDKEVITTVAQPTQTQHQGKLFTVYPNPTRGSFTLELTELPQYPGITVEIYGITGNQVLSAELSGETVYSLSLEGRQPGIYIVRVLIGDQIGVERIIKR